MTEFDYESLIEDIPDYPKPGVVFRDITPLLADAEGFAAVVRDLAEPFRNAGVTKVVGAEARCFLVGAPVAYRLGCGFVPARKPGKLPREVLSESYALEYGTDELQIHCDAITPEDKVLVVDDLVATGGTAVACARMIERAGAEFCGFAFLMELAFLNPRDIIGKEFKQEIFSLFTVD